MRKLSLKKETLVQLSSDELGDIAGASYRTKYECTESHQVCNPLSRDLCIQIGSALGCLQTKFCIPTQTC